MGAETGQLSVAPSGLFRFDVKITFIEERKCQHSASLVVNGNENPIAKCVQGFFGRGDKPTEGRGKYLLECTMTIVHRLEAHSNVALLVKREGNKGPGPTLFVSNATTYFIISMWH